MHKKYSYRNGKRYGPYYYENKRVNGKVVTTYLGANNSFERRRNNVYWIFAVVGLLFIFSILFIFSEQINLGILFSPSEPFSISLSQSRFESGQAIVGELNLHLSNGELIPSEAKVVASLSGVEKSFTLFELLGDKYSISEGNFYLEGSEISGSGRGYGLVGSKETYPDVNFKFRITKPVETDTEIGGSDVPKEISGESPSETPVEVPAENPAETPVETPSETPAEVPAENPAETPVETPSEIPAGNPSASDETVSGTGGDAASEPSVSENSGSGESESSGDAGTSSEGSSSEEGSSSGESSGSSEGSGDSGGEPSLSPELVTTNVMIIDGTVSKNSPFNYGLESGWSAELVSGSVKIDDESVDDGIVTLEENENGLVVSTDYSVLEEGFGQDFLGDEILDINIDFGKFEFAAPQENGVLDVRVEYMGQTLFEASEDVFSGLIGENSTEENGTVKIPGTNETFGNETVGSETNLTQPQIVLGQSVVWVKRVNAVGPIVLTVELPESARIISVEGIEADISEGDASVPESVEEPKIAAEKSVAEGIGLEKITPVIEQTEGELMLSPSEIRTQTISVSIDANELGADIVYETPAAEITSREIAENKIIITVSAPDLGPEYEYTNVLIFENVPAKFIGKMEGARVYWREGAQYLPVEKLEGDSIFFTAPHLSNQTFEIIFITKAEHLDENRTFVEDVYEFVRKRDNNWTTILEGNYLRVVFEQNLTSDKDITIYARSNETNASIEVYENNGTEIIASFGAINEDKEYRILLTNLTNEQDIFDLLVAGGNIEFDYVVDPQIIANVSEGDGMNVTLENGFSHLSISTSGEINDSNLVLYLPFDVNSTNSTGGENQYDYTTRNNDAVLSGNAHWNNAGFIGGSYSFDGDGDYLRISNDDSLRFSKNMTWSAWVYPFDITGEGIFSRGGTSEGYSIGINGGRVYFYEPLSDGSVQSTGSITANTWTHIAIIAHPNGMVYFYINGVLDSSSPVLLGQSDVSSNLLVGRAYDTKDEETFYTYDFNGAIDEVMILNTSLSDAQINAIYSNQSARFFSRGEQILTNINASANPVNITINSTMLKGSEIKLSVGNRVGGDYVYGPEQSFVGNSINDISLSTPENISLKFVYYSDGNSFYSPTLGDDVLFSGSIVSFPSVRLNSPENDSNHFTSEDLILNATADDSGGNSIATRAFVVRAQDKDNFLTSAVFNKNISAGSDMIHNLTAVPVSISSQALLSYWNFEDYNGSIILDNLGSNFLTASGNQIVSDNGRFGKAFFYDGTNDYFFDDSFSGFDVTSGSISLWIKPSQSFIDSGYRKVYLVDSDNDFDVAISHYNPGNDVLNVNYPTPTSYGTVSHSITLTSSKWTNIVYTYNVPYNYRVYIDGALVEDYSPGAEFPPYSAQNNFYLGGKKSVLFLKDDWWGEIDDVAIWGRELDQADVSDIYSLSEGKYFWKVNATNSLGNSVISETWEFNLINLVELSECGELNEAGAYYLLMNDISSAAGSCFNITANDITLDGAGKLIAGDYDNGGIAVKTSEVKNATVKNLRINGFGTGVYLNLTNHSTIENVDSSANIETGFFLRQSDGNLIKNSFSRDNNVSGIELLESKDVVIQNNSVVNSSKGIFLSYGNSNNIIRYNVVENNSLGGFFAENSRNDSVYGNVFNNQFYGVYAANSMGEDISFNEFNDNTHGVYINSSHSNVIDNNNLRSVLSGLLIEYSNNTKISNNWQDSEYTLATFEGLSLKNSSNNIIINNSFHKNRCFFMDGSNNNSVFNLSLSSCLVGLQVLSSDENHFYDTSISSFLYGGVIVSFSSRNNFYETNINRSGLYAFLIMGQSNENKFIKIRMQEPLGSGKYDLFVNTTDPYLVRGLSFEDSNLESYSIEGNNLNFKVRNSWFGEINFLQSVNGTGANFSSDVRIRNNSAVVRSDLNIGLNKSANITLYGIGEREFREIAILRDGKQCPTEICYNFTSLTDENVSFNVSSWTEYEVGDLLAVTECRELDEPNTVYALGRDILYVNETCINVTADNVTLDGNGHVLSGCGAADIDDDGMAGSGDYALLINCMGLTCSGNPSCCRADINGDGIVDSEDGNIVINCFGLYLSSLSAVFSEDRRSLTVRNLNITDFGTGIYFANVSNSLVERVDISDNYYEGVYLHSGHNNTILNNIIIRNYYGVLLHNSKETNLSSNNFSFNLWGVYLNDSQSSMVDSNIFLSNNFSAIHLKNSSYNLILNNQEDGGMIDWGYGLSAGDSNSNELRNNLFRNNHQGGIAFFQSSNNSGFNNSIYSGRLAFNIFESSNNTFRDTRIEYANISLRLTSFSQNNFFDGLIINNSMVHGIEISPAFPTCNNNSFANLKIFNTSSGGTPGYDLYINGEDFISINGLSFTDSEIERYFIKNLVSDFRIENSQFGEIKFLQSVNGTGNNLSEDIRIDKNSAIVESDSNVGFNRSANVTLYKNPAAGFNDPGIFRDNLLCPANVCQNFTSLTAENVSFSVSGWTEYHLGERRIPISSCPFTMDSPNREYFLMNNIVSGDNCLLIGASNITLDGNGYSVTGSAADNRYGISNVRGGVDCSGSYCYEVYTDVKIKNVTVVNFARSVYFKNLTNSVVYNIVSTGSGTYGHYALYFENGKNNSVVNSDIYDSSPEGRSFIFDKTSDDKMVNTRVISSADGAYFVKTNKTEIIDSSITKYSLNSDVMSQIDMTFENTQFGKIRFLQPVSGSGINFSSDVRIRNNSAVVRSDLNVGLNKSANITLYGIGEKGFNSPGILRDGLFACNAQTVPSCSNFTSLTAENVSFNVSSWTNYSIAEGQRPPFVILDSPADNANTTNRTLSFNWSAVDPNGNAITDVQINVSCYHFSGGSCSSDGGLIGFGDYSNNYTWQSELWHFYDDQYYYNWTVRARDSFGWGDWAPERRFNLESFVSVTLLNSGVDFGELRVGDNEDTVDDSPLPLILRNTGNVLVNVTLNASDLWISPGYGNPTQKYLFKIDNPPSTPITSFDVTESIVSWTPVPNYTALLSSIVGFKYNESYITAEVDLNITVPPSEPVGERRSTLTFIAGRTN